VGVGCGNCKFVDVGGGGGGGRMDMDL